MHRDRARPDAGPGIRNAQRLQQSLHASVFTTGTMKGHERDLDFVVTQLLDDRSIHIKGDGVIPATQKRLVRGLPGSERDLPLSRLPAH
jgi:hypothetical protein